jgi:hypothetical protein
MLQSCKKSNNVIPNVPVDVYIYMNQPLSANLKVPGGWIYAQGGVKGILVYNSGNDVFRAYDRACTYDPQTSCSSVTVGIDNVTAIDSCCGGDACCKSKYLIVDGAPMSGPTTIALVQYRTFLNSDGTELHITN